MAAPSESTPFNVEGKSAIVTGAGSGINYEFAKLLLSRKCNVLIADLSLRPEAKKLVDDHSAKDDSKPRAVFLKTNVTIWDDLTQMFEEAEREFGDVSIICPGAGVFEPTWSNFWHPPGTPESKDSLHGDAASGIGRYGTLDLNLVHPIRTTQMAISRWLNPTGATTKASPTNPKRIVHISSIAGQAPSFAVCLYVVSKHGLSGFIRSMYALETLGIRVNGVAPGLIKTPLWTDHPEKMRMLNTETDTWIEPVEVAEQMVRCCEDDTIGPGVVWEVLKGAYRSVGWRQDPGFTGPGSVAGNGKVVIEDIFNLLATPGWGVPQEK